MIIDIFRLGIGKERPAFTALLTGIPTISGMNTFLKFDKVILNRAGGYDPKTGIFTAPRTGLYQISSTIMSDSGNNISLFIVKNDVRILNMYAAAPHGSTETANPVLELKAGDKVSVRNNSSGSQRFHGNSYSYIYGYFISE